MKRTENNIYRTQSLKPIENQKTGYPLRGQTEQKKKKKSFANDAIPRTQGEYKITR